MFLWSRTSLARCAKGQNLMLYNLIVPGLYSGNLLPETGAINIRIKISIESKANIDNLLNYNIV